MGTRGSMTRRTVAALALSALALLAVGPAANAQEMSVAPSEGLLFIDADTVWGPANIPDEERPMIACVQSSRFAKNEEVVWRVKVVDPSTGQPMDDTQLASVQVMFAAGEPLALRYGPHPRDTPVDFFWTVGWDVPEDYPTGVVEYTIQATANDGRTGTWEQFGVTLAQLTITDEVRPIIEEEES